jgi:phage I-like protein
MNGENIGQEIDHELLGEMIRVFKKRQYADPVIIDWQHATSPFQGGHPAPPESGNALGLIVDIELREDGLYATPAYNERGLDVVKSAGGVLWSSPEFIVGDVFARDGGNPIGSAQLLAITLTPRPAQSNDKIGRVLLNERTTSMDNIEALSVEELRQMLVAKDALVKELEQKMKDMMEDSESAMVDEKEETMMEEEDKAEKMAESKEEDKAEKMMEDEEKKSYKMSETLTESTLLSEVQALRENNAKLSQRLEAIEAEKKEVEKREAVNLLLNEGKITPSEVEVAGKAFELRELQGEFWTMFSERPSNSAVPLVEVGHGASGQEINKATLDQEVRKLASEKSVSYSEALNLFAKSNPDYYNKVFGA